MLLLGMLLAGALLSGYLSCAVTIFSRIAGVICSRTTTQRSLCQPEARP